MELLTVGDVTVDLFLPVPRLPERGGDVHTDRVILRAGGAAANVAAVASTLGLPAALVGAVGRDPLGEWVIRELEASGVRLAALQRCPEAPTSLIAILVTPDGERTMISGRGASRFVTLEETARDRIARVTFFHLSGYALLEESPLFFTALALLEQARGAGCLCTFDPGPIASRIAREIVFRVLPSMDGLFVNEQEAAALFGRDPRTAFAGADRLRWVVIKQGNRGCRWLSRQGEGLSIPAFLVPVVDTTGAGDAFDAGFLAGLAGGLPPPAAALIGNAAGALACTGWGVIGSFPGRFALRRLLEQAATDPAWSAWQDLLGKALAWASGSHPTL